MARIELVRVVASATTRGLVYSNVLVMRREDWDVMESIGNQDQLKSQVLEEMLRQAPPEARATALVEVTTEWMDLD